MQHQRDATEEASRPGSWAWLTRQIAEELRKARSLSRGASTNRPFLKLLAEHTQASRVRRKAAKE